MPTSSPSFLTKQPPLSKTNSIISSILKTLKQQIIALFNASDLGKVTDIKFKTENISQDVQEQIAKHPETLNL